MMRAMVEEGKNHENKNSGDAHTLEKSKFSFDIIK